MAISKIHPICYSVLDAISYIVNPEKTQDEMLVSSFACGIHTADQEFAQTAFLGSSLGKVKAQHLIQAFAPGEVSAQTAHEIGYKLAMELTNGEHEFVLSTHVDKDHIHNHIIFNQVSFVSHKKFRQNIDTFHRMQNINDRLCASYGLSVIQKPDKKAKTYYEYKDLKQNNSHRQVLKNTIDSCIPLVSSFEELLSMLQHLGYEVKVTDKNYSFKKEEHARFIRIKTLGDHYSFDAISKRIQYKHVDAMPYVMPPKSDLGLLSDLSRKLEHVKSPAYQNKVALSEVKRLAATYAFLNQHGINSVDEIKRLQSAWSMEVKNLHKEAKGYEKEMDRLSEIAALLKKREDNQHVFLAYKKSGKDPAFYEKHRTSLMLFESACKGLLLHGVDNKTTFREVKEKLDAVTKKRDAVLQEYHALSSDLKQLNIASKNIDLILDDREQKHASFKKQTKNR